MITLDTCRLCKRKSFEQAEFEAGNNAEIPVWLDLCQKHYKEFEKDGDKFQEKHFKIIEQLAAEKMAGRDYDPFDHREGL